MGQVDRLTDLKTERQVHVLKACPKGMETHWRTDRRLGRQTHILTGGRTDIETGWWTNSHRGWLVDRQKARMHGDRQTDRQIF